MDECVFEPAGEGVLGLFKSLRLEHGERLLIRGGTTSVGLAAAAIATLHGAIAAYAPQQAWPAYGGISVALARPASYLPTYTAVPPRGSKH
jgi:hypothetical protein